MRPGDNRDPEADALRKAQRREAYKAQQRLYNARKREEKRAKQELARAKYAKYSANAKARKQAKKLAQELEQAGR